MRVAATIVVLSLVLVSGAFYPLATAPDKNGGIKTTDTAPSAQHTRAGKPTGWGPFSRGYREYQVAIPSRATEGLDPNVTARVYYPAASNGSGAANDTSQAPYPTIVYLPGGASTHSYVDGNAEMISSYGFVVVNIGLGYTPSGDLRDPQKMAGEVKLVLDWITTKNSTTGSELEGMMDIGRFGISGHSWGGVTSAYAVTSQYGDARIKACHPVSATPVGNIDAMDTCKVPFQEMCGSNGDNSPYPFYDRVNVPKTAIVVRGADHQGVRAYEEYQVSFFRYWFYKDQGYETYIYGEAVRADLASNILSLYSFNLSESHPSLSGSPVMEDTAVTLDGNISGLTLNSSVIYKWDFEGDGIYDFNSTTTASTMHVYTAEGNFTPTFAYIDTYEGETKETSLNVINIVPSAVASPEMSGVEDQLLKFNASGCSDTPTDLLNLLFKWDFGDGYFTSFVKDPIALHSYVQTGTYYATLTVKDDSTQNSTTVEVSISNLPPVAKIACDMLSAYEDEAISFDALGSKDTPSDNSSISFKWSFGDGSTSANPQAKHAYAQTGKFNVSLEVTDNDDAKGYAHIWITVSNKAPQITLIGPNVIAIEDEDVELTAEATDTEHDKGSLVYRWSLRDGVTSAWAPTPDASHAYAKAGAYKAVLFVRDNDGAVTNASIWVNVTNQAPTVECSADRTTADEAQSVLFSCTPADTPSDMDSLTYLWDFGDGSSSTERSSRHAFNTSGKNSVTLTVTDNDGASASQTMVITVKNLPPTVAMALNRTMIYEAESISFDAASSKDTQNDMAGLGYNWSFGDNGTASGKEASHTYARPGTFEVTLAVTDGDGATAWATAKVTVRPLKAGDDDDVAIDDDDIISDDDDDNLTHNATVDDDGNTVAFVVISVILVIVIIAAVAVIIFLARSRRGTQQEQPSGHEKRAARPEANRATNPAPGIKNIPPRNKLERHTGPDETKAGHTGKR